MIPSSSLLIDDAQAEVAYLAVRLVVLAETMQLVSRSSSEAGVDNEQIQSALDAFARAGVGRQAPSFQRHGNQRAMASMLHGVLSVIEESPLPQHEWGPMAELLGDDLLATLVRTSASSIRRYTAGERSTPDHIADRLHALTLMCAALLGSYNDFGIRRWFRRRRSALGGASPLEVFSRDWSPSDEKVHEVGALAESLIGSPAT